MAIALTFEDVKEKFGSSGFKSIDEFEEFYLMSLCEQDIGRPYYTRRDGKEVALDGVCHNPPKEYEVWIEGYSATGESSKCSLFGKAIARNFKEACHIVACENYLKRVVEEQGSGEYSLPGRWDYSPPKMSYWGCKFYWNEKLASKNFG